MECLNMFSWGFQHHPLPAEGSLGLSAFGCQVSSASPLVSALVRDTDAPKGTNQGGLSIPVLESWVSQQEPCGNGGISSCALSGGEVPVGLQSSGVNVGPWSFPAMRYFVSLCC
jgi:hypothetical protein